MINNSLTQPFHIPVMLKETIEYLFPVLPAQVKAPMYIDATLGGGGHSQAILDKISNGIVVGLDLDIDAIEYSKNRLKNYSNFHLFHTSYTNLDKIIAQFPDYTLQGIVFDLGVSSYQLTRPERGFSYLQPGLLDMRFDQSTPAHTAQDIIQHTSEYDLAQLLFEYGEERYARKIARLLYKKRNTIHTTTDIAVVIQSIIHNKNVNKTLSRVFQALRIFVNNELENIKIGLTKAIQLCTAGARIIVIAYHSLEDRIAKQIFKDNAHSEIIHIITKKPLRPSLAEVNINPSARSARFRVAEKI